MGLVIGIDGGASKMQAVIVDLMARSSAGAGVSNYQGVWLARPQAAIDAAFADAGGRTRS